MILASQSPRRIELMREAGFDVRIIPADIDETPLEDETPEHLVGRLSRCKAQTVADAYGDPGEIVVAADTVVAIAVYSGTIVSVTNDTALAVKSSMIPASIASSSG